MIKRKGNKFYVEIFNPKHDWKYLGCVITFRYGTNAFCTHIKDASRHFYRKEQGYPINLELLKTLYSVQIDYLVIPEDGETGFCCYLGKTKEYLEGTLVSEHFTERQKVIPRNELEQIIISREKIKGALYDR